jgi:hypothetical protein
MAEANSLTPQQRENIRKILNRAFSIKFADVQNPARNELHIISARNGIICLLACDGWDFEEISALMRKPPEYCSAVLKKFFQDADQREDGFGKA